MKPTWDGYFMIVVDALAARATCDRGRSAAVFVKDHDILASGYVGSPPGFAHCDDVGHLMSEDGKHCVRTIHAEQNGVIRAARNGVSLKGSTVYCTMEPCRVCAMTLIGVGVVRVVAKNAYHAAGWSREAFASAGIELLTLNEEELYASGWALMCAARGTDEDWCGDPGVQHVCGDVLGTDHVHMCRGCDEPFYGRC